MDLCIKCMDLELSVNKDCGRDLYWSPRIAVALVELYSVGTAGQEIKHPISINLLQVYNCHSVSSTKCDSIIAILCQSIAPCN